LDNSWRVMSPAEGILLHKIQPRGTSYEFPLVVEAGELQKRGLGHQQTWQMVRWRRPLPFRQHFLYFFTPIYSLRVSASASLISTQPIAALRI